MMMNKRISGLLACVCVASMCMLPVSADSSKDYSAEFSGYYGIEGYGDVWFYESRAKNSSGEWKELNRLYPEDQVFGALQYTVPIFESAGGGCCVKADGWMYPGEEDIAVTFVAPADGNVQIPSFTVRRNHNVGGGEGDGVFFSITNNDENVWPKSGNKRCGPEEYPSNNLVVPNVKVGVHKGDKLRFVINMGENDVNDQTDLYGLTVKFAEGEPVIATTATTSATTIAAPVTTASSAESTTASTGTDKTTTPGAETTSPGDVSDTQAGTWIIVGIVAGIAVLAAAGIGIVLYIRKKKAADPGDSSKNG